MEAKVGRLLVFLIIFFRVISPGYAQQDLEKLLGDLPEGNQEVSISSSYSNEEQPLFWPDDLYPLQERAETKFNHLVKNKHGLFIKIEGTSRLYQVTKMANKFDIIRRDSTNNFGDYSKSYVFSYQDTIFSLGDKGLSGKNDDLSYYSFSSGQWNQISLNLSVPIINSGLSSLGLHINRKLGKLYYIGNPNAHKNADKMIAPSTRVFELDLKTYSWNTKGVITKKAFNILKNSKTIAALPWGELIIKNEGDVKQVYLLNYSANQVYQLSAVLTDTQKFDFLNKTMHPESIPQSIRYFKNDSLYINTLAKNLVIPLELSDFNLTDVSIYKPEHVSSEFIAGFSSYWLLAVGIMVFLIYLFHKPISSYLGFSFGSIQFTKMEWDLIQFIFNNPEHSISLEEINLILGTSRKSLDVQKKVRSEIVRSINTKYWDFIGQRINLIAKERLPYDKRLMRYYIDENRYRKISHLAINAPNDLSDVIPS